MLIGHAPDMRHAMYLQDKAPAITAERVLELMASTPSTAAALEDEPPNPLNSRLPAPPLSLP